MCRRWSTMLGVVGTLAAAALAACGDGSGPGEGPGSLTADLGVTLQDEVEALLNALTVPTLLTPVGAAASQPCVSPSSATDSDGDGVPDDATYQFVAPPCRFADFRGGTLEITGQLRVQDPTPTTAAFGHNITLTNLRYRFLDEDDQTVDVTRNGIRSVTGSVSSLSLASDLQLLRTFAGKADAAVDKQWTVTFTPSAALQINQPLPSGEVEVAGTFNWTRGAESLALTVTTPERLVYDARCAGTPQRIRGGELRASGTIDGTDGYVRVRWDECGEDPDFEFVEGD